MSDKNLCGETEPPDDMPIIRGERCSQACRPPAGAPRKSNAALGNSTALCATTPVTNFAKIDVKSRGPLAWSSLLLDACEAKTQSANNVRVEMHHSLRQYPGSDLHLLPSSEEHLALHSDGLARGEGVVAPRRAGAGQIAREHYATQLPQGQVAMQLISSTSKAMPSPARAWILT